MAFDMALANCGLASGMSARESFTAIGVRPPVGAMLLSRM
jgi:hypothetical protein